MRSDLGAAANRVRLPGAAYRDLYKAKLAQAPTHAHQRAGVLTARQWVRLVAAWLRASAVYQPQDRKAGHPTPHAARPRPHKRAPLVSRAR